MSLSRRSGAHFLTSDGENIYYERSEGACDFTLMLLHGLGGDLNAWRKEREMFEKESFNVIAVDLRGHGLSSRPEETDKYSIQRYAKDLCELFSSLRLSNVVLAGHCFGGVVALVTASQCKVVSKLILVDSTFKPPYFSSYFPHTPWMTKIANSLLPYMSSRHFKGHRDFTHIEGTPDWSIPRLLSDVTHSSLRSYLSASRTFHSLNLRSILTKINIPTLIIEGENDSIIPPDIARAMHKAIPQSELVLIPRANHILVINQPHEVTKVIMKFLTQTRHR